MNKNNLQVVCAFFLIVLLSISVDFRAEAKSKFNDDSAKSDIIDTKRLLKDVKFLSSDELKGRETGTKENEIARKYVVKRFKESGIEPFESGYIQKFSFRNRQGKEFKGANVVGVIKGKSEPQKFIVISAHFDHIGVRNGEIYNGADDNASGTAALFAIAEYFSKHQPNKSLVFAAFDAEEKGLQGARYFVENPSVKLGEILLNINMDMISRNVNGELYAAGTFPYPQLKPYLETVQQNAKVKLLLGHDNPNLGRDDWTFQSDHGAFHRKQIPFIYFGVEDHKDYHKPTDDFENIQPEFYVKAVETILSATKEFDANL
ncbi:MAG: M28 family peptidase [Pyrinomonadaceae bacterium]